MRRILLWLLLFLPSLSLRGQALSRAPGDTAADDSNPLESHLARIAAEARVVGLGEATHGTKEFSLIKSAIVRRLISRHGFRYFLLEASYLDCRRINAFIHGQPVDTQSLFRGIPWPWATEEFYSLLQWMRDYNAGVSEARSIVFLGSDIGDMHTIKDMLAAGKDSSEGQYPASWLQRFMDTGLTEREKIHFFTEQWKHPPRCRDFRDSLVQKNLLESILFSLMQGGRKYAYREKRLADFTMGLIDHFDHDKFILWSHNGHITQKSEDRKSAGNFLHQRYGPAYVSIGFDFQQGCFRAADIDSNRYERNLFRLNVFCVDSSTFNLASYIPGEPFNQVVLPLRHPEGKALLPAKFLIRSVGAVYGHEMAAKRPFLYYEKVYRERSFDYLIIVHHSSPSTSYYRQAASP